MRLALPPAPHVVDVTQKPIGFWFGRDGRTRRAQRVEVCPGCGQHGVPIRVVRRAGCGSEPAFAHRVLPHGYEAVCVVHSRSAWVASKALRQRLAGWLVWALAVPQADGTRTTLRALAGTLGCSWQAVRALPRCAKLPGAPVLTALELHSQGLPGGPITAAEWSVARYTLPRYPI